MKTLIAIAVLMAALPCVAQSGRWHRATESECKALTPDLGILTFRNTNGTDFGVQTCGYSDGISVEPLFFVAGPNGATCRVTPGQFGELMSGEALAPRNLASFCDSGKMERVDIARK